MTFLSWLTFNFQAGSVVPQPHTRYAPTHRMEHDIPIYYLPSPFSSTDATSRTPGAPSIYKQTNKRTTAVWFRPRDRQKEHRSEETFRSMENIHRRVRRRGKSLDRGSTIEISRSTGSRDSRIDLNESRPSWTRVRDFPTSSSGTTFQRQWIR